jgi:Zn-dependent M16 (insulinase) family peptidase
MAKRQQTKRLFIQADTIANFCVDARRTVLFSDPMSPVASVFAKFATESYIHTLIRVELGAYGGWAIHDSRRQRHQLSSYRDSNVVGVLRAFDRALEMAANGEGMTEEAIENALVKLFSEIDRPLAPQDKGSQSWIWGDSAEVIQGRRNVFYAVTKEQLVKLAKWLKEQPSVQAAFSSETIAKAPEGFTVIPVLETGS